MQVKRICFTVALVLFLGFTAHAKLKITANVAGASASSPGQPCKDMMWQTAHWNWAQASDSGNTKPGFFGGIDRYPWPILSRPLDDIRANAPLDENNWPTEVPFNYQGVDYRPVWTPFNWFCPVDQVPLGTYTFIGEGTGIVDLGWEIDLRIELNGGVTVVEFNIDQINPDNTFENETFNAMLGAKSSGLCMTIVESDPNDHVRNIHVIRPDENGGTSWVQDYKECPWNPAYIESHAIYNSLRFMGFANANTNTQVEWADRITPDMLNASDRDIEQAPYMGDGPGSVSPAAIPWEHQIKFANAAGVDPWFTLPARANEDYVRNLAQLVYEMLDPSLNVYVEWANETWNPIFYGLHQTTYVKNNYNSNVNSNEEAHAYMCARNTGIFEEVFGSDKDRIFGVASGFVNGTGVGNKIVAALNNPAINPDNIKVDCYAVASYFNPSSGPSMGGIDAAVSLANSNGMRPLMYEGGCESGRGPAMYNAIWDALVDYDNAGMENFNAFVAVDGWGTFGAWGFKLYNDQPLDDPNGAKFKALYDWTVENNQYDPNSSVPGCGTGGTPIMPMLQPSESAIPLRLLPSDNAVYDIAGRRVHNSANSGGAAGIMIRKTGVAVKPMVK